jgi:hypothetical protein
MVRIERHPKKKGYMRMHTSLGDLNLELHCDIAPRACENFFVLAESGYYTDTVFHRSIRSFMIQVGAPPTRPRACVHMHIAGFSLLARPCGPQWPSWTPSGPGVFFWILCHKAFLLEASAQALLGHEEQELRRAGVDSPGA